jgi:putative cell wall-binding protein
LVGRPFSSEKELRVRTVSSTVMRRMAAAVFLAVFLAGLLAALIVPSGSSAPAPRPHPVTPEIHTLPLAGVDRAALAELRRQDPDAHPAVLTPPRATETFELLGVSWTPTAKAPGIQVQVRTRGDKGWSSWSELELEDVFAAPQGALDPSDDSADTRAGTEPMYTGPSSGVQVRVDRVSGELPGDLQVNLVDPGTSVADSSATTLAGATAGAQARPATVMRPAIVTRAQWGADESLRNGFAGYGQTIKAGFVHHTTGASDYASADVPGMIRAIYAYHTLTLGWSDIGYNFIVDRFGRLFEGRWGGVDQPVIGAHTGGFNTDTVGVAALGDYETNAAPDAVVAAFGRILGWKLGLYGRDPYGRTTLTSGGGDSNRYPLGQVVEFNVVSGHRDASYTLCPGQYLYPRLDQIRSEAATYMAHPGTTEKLAQLASDSVTRIQGADRIATAIDASQFLFGPATDPATAAGAVVLARSDLFPDALAGVPLAAASVGPLLITPPTQLDGRVAGEIVRILPKDKPVYLLGGTGALSQGVEDAVKALGYTNVKRLQGSSRFLTALAIAQQVEQVLAPAPPSLVLIATGWNFPDALGGGAAAGAAGGVVVLSDNATLPQPVLDYVAQKQQAGAFVATVGGPAAPSYPAADRAIVGADRYDTAASVAKTFFVSATGEGPVTAGLATGTTFPDALSGGALMALLGGPMLLTQPTTLNAHAGAFLSTHRARIDYAFISGGGGAVSNAVDGQVAAAIAD